MGGLLWICACVVCVVLTFVMLKVKPVKNQRLEGFLRISTVLSFAITALVVFSPLFMEYTRFLSNKPDEDRVAQIENGKVVDTSEYFVFCTGQDCVNYLVAAEVESMVRPITDNPKVRVLNYTVGFEIIDPELAVAYVAQCYKEEHQDKRQLPVAITKDESKEVLQKRISYYLYDFNDSYSKELAHFHNPERPEQKQAFLELLQEKINPGLKEVGLKITGVSWDVI
ncbi:hypothetical protein HQ571_04400 [Candidatus Kuenenbacteria bacterium]|nr:hypothetical protein [Candidatus Kuenenbacteria bacterium]